MTGKEINPWCLKCINGKMLRDVDGLFLWCGQQGCKLQRDNPPTRFEPIKRPAINPEKEVSQ